MSSFIGHSLAGLTAYAIVAPQQWSLSRRNRSQFLWIVFVVIVASLPDIDYLIPALRIREDDRILRITHSSIGTLLVPILTILLLWLAGKRGKILKIMSLQVILSGLSHLCLDLATGVFPLPLLYPFSHEVFRLPFGLLPSAGKIQITNYWLYHNLFIELGAIVPLFYSLISIARARPQKIADRLKISVAIMISAGFMFWAYSLDRSR